MIATTSLLVSVLLTATPKCYVTVQGDAYLRFVREGRVVYASEAALVVIDGKVCHESGPKLLPEIMVPDANADLEISEDGTVNYVRNGNSVRCGRLMLAKFETPLLSSPNSSLLSSQDRPTLIFAQKEGEIKITQEPGRLKVVESAEVIKPEPPVQTPPKTTPVVKTEPKPTVSQIKPTPTAPTAVKAPVAPKLEIKPTVEVEGDSILLSDVADISASPELTEQLKRVVVDASPVFGSVRKLDVFRLEYRLRQAGIDPKSVVFAGSRTFEVRRKAQWIPNDQFEQAALTTLKAKFGDQAAFKLTSPFEPMPVRTGTVSLQPAEPRLTGNTLVIPVQVFLDGSLVNARTLTFTMQLPFALPKVGSTIVVRTRAGSIRVETSGKVVRTEPNSMKVEVELEDRSRVSGTLIGDGVIEVNL